MPAPSEPPVLIGVDGGATEVRAHEVLVLSAAGALALGLGAASASCRYDRAKGFRPVPMSRQLLARERGRVEPTPLERAQGDLWVDAAARTIVSAAEQSGARSVRVAMCLPGLKTADLRGVDASRNGPRIPDFLDRLEARLRDAGLALATPIAGLAGDGEACGHGEEADARGLFRGIANAYYLGGGTGLAEALKQDGRVLGLDELSGRLKKAWQLESEEGRSFEDLLSMRAINAGFARRSARSGPGGSSPGGAGPGGSGELPEIAAARGDEAARSVLAEAAAALAELVAVRLREMPAIERVVLGQHLGRLHLDPALRGVFRDRVEADLARRLGGRTPREGLIRGSTLRAAPAIGAVAMAVAADAGGEAGRASRG